MNERIERQFAHWLVRGSRLLDGDFFFFRFVCSFLRCMLLHLFMGEIFMAFLFRYIY